MPAINLARLRKQAVELAQYFFEPKRFDFHFTELLDFYSNRTIKPGKQTSNNTYFKAYKVQDPVLRTIMDEIRPLVIQSPDAALSLANLLWGEMVLEKRIFATRMLELQPKENAQSTLNLLGDWAINCREDQLLEEIASHPLLTIHYENWVLLIEHLNKWMLSENDMLIRLSLISLNIILTEHNITDLPSIFKLLTPLISEPTFSQRSLLNPIFKSLVRQSPGEIVFLIRQIYNSQEVKNKGFLWLLKQNLEYFPETYRESLESMI